MDTAWLAWLRMTSALANRRLVVSPPPSAYDTCRKIFKNKKTRLALVVCMTIPIRQLIPPGLAYQRCFVFCIHVAPFSRATNGASARQQPSQAGARLPPASGTTAPPAAQQRGASSTSPSPHVAQAAGQAAQQNQRKVPAPQRPPVRSQQHQHPSQVC